MGDIHHTVIISVNSVNSKTGSVLRGRWVDNVSLEMLWGGRGRIDNGDG